MDGQLRQMLSVLCSYRRIYVYIFALLAFSVSIKISLVIA